MLGQQQVRLLTGMARLLNRLLHSLQWHELSAIERRRVHALLAHLDSDTAFALAIAERGYRADVPEIDMPSFPRGTAKHAAHRRRELEARPGRVMHAQPAPDAAAVGS